MNFLTAIFGAIKEVFGFASQRTALKNAADVKAAKAAQTERAEVDRTTAAVAGENLTEERNEFAE